MNVIWNKSKFRKGEGTGVRTLSKKTTCPVFQTVRAGRGECEADKNQAGPFKPSDLRRWNFTSEISSSGSNNNTPAASRRNRIPDSDAGTPRDSEKDDNFIDLQRWRMQRKPKILSRDNTPAAFSPRAISTPLKIPGQRRSATIRATSSDGTETPRNFESGLNPFCLKYTHGSDMRDHLQNMNSPFKVPSAPIAKVSKPGNRSNLSSSDGLTPQPSPTPTRSLKSARSGPDDNSRIVIAITEGRGRALGEVGIAAMDVKSPRLVVCQISDTQTFTNTLRKVNVFNPVEVIFPNTLVEGTADNKLFQTIYDQFPNATVTTVQRRFFNSSQGLEELKNVCLPEYASVIPIVEPMYFALAALAALLKYAEFIQNLVFSKKSLRVDFETGENIVLIDMDTCRKLDLIQNVRIRGMKTCLLDVLNNCATIGGKKHLRSSILQPTYDISIIQNRLDSIAELIENQHLFCSLKSIVGKFRYVEQLLSLCMVFPNVVQNGKSAETQINYCLTLKTTLDELPHLRSILDIGRDKFFKSFKACLEDPRYKKMFDRIVETLNEDAQRGKNFAMSQFHRCFAVKAGISSYLDVLRTSYSERISDFNEIVKDLAQKHNLPLMPAMLGAKGMVIRLKLTKNSNFNLRNLSTDFIVVDKSNVVLTLLTPELMFLQRKIRHLLNEIQVVTSVIMLNMLNDFREDIGCLYKLCENMAELDVLLSLAQTSAALNYTRPFFGPCTDVRNSRHPILEFVSNQQTVPNDIYASVDRNFHLITGPNMSGKSVYIRQVALIQIMAQMGCYVPAESARFRICDRIFSRLGYGDTWNSSAFQLQMKEMTRILKGLTARTLVIVDELGRSTTVEDGASLAFAFAEALADGKAFVFFTTHFPILAKMAGLYGNVRNYHFETIAAVEEDKEDGESMEDDESEIEFRELEYTHRLAPGVKNVPFYGLRLAGTTFLGKDIIHKSRAIAKRLSHVWQPSFENPRVDPSMVANELTLKLLEMKTEDRLNLETIKGVQEYARKKWLEREEDVEDDATISEGLRVEETDGADQVDKVQTDGEHEEIKDYGVNDIWDDEEIAEKNPAGDILQRSHNSSVDEEICEINSIMGMNRRDGGEKEIVSSNDEGSNEEAAFFDFNEKSYRMHKTYESEEEVKDDDEEILDDFYRTDEEVYGADAEIYGPDAEIYGDGAKIYRVGESVYGPDVDIYEVDVDAHENGTDEDNDGSNKNILAAELQKADKEFNETVKKRNADDEDSYRSGKEVNFELMEQVNGSEKDEENDKQHKEMNGITGERKKVPGWVPSIPVDYPFDVNPLTPFTPFGNDEEPREEDERDKKLHVHAHSTRGRESMEGNALKNTDLEALKRNVLSVIYDSDEEMSACESRESTYDEDRRSVSDINELFQERRYNFRLN